MIENVSTQLTVFHCFAHCLLPGRAFASLYVLLFLEKEAEIGGRVLVFCVFLMMSWVGLQCLVAFPGHTHSFKLCLSSINVVSSQEVIQNPIG